MASKYTAVERLKINLDANRKVGRRKEKQDGDSADETDFMEQCVQNLVDSGEFDDEADAEAVCQMLYDNGGDMGDMGN